MADHAGEEQVAEPPEPGRGFDVLDDSDMLQVIGHPLRLRAVVEAAKAPVSAKELASMFEVPLPRMSYHVRALADAGLLQVVRRTQRRGAVETHYRAISTMEVNDRMMDDAAPDSIRLWTQAQLRILAEDVLQAVDAGAGSDRDFLLARGHFAVSAEGRERLKRELDDIYARLAALEKELRVEAGDDDVEELNIVLLSYAGRRTAGRNGPMMTGFDTGGRDTIPP